jgi:flagellar biosynthesis protein FliR
VAELSAGLLVGFAVRAIWTALAWNAELIAQQAGLMGSPAANDDLPESPLARLYGLVALAVLFAGGGHRLVLAALLAEPMPPTMGGDELAAAAGRMLMAASELAVRVATPAALAVWAGTFATAMAARTLPRIVLGQTTLPVPLMLVLAAAAASISAVPSAVRIAVTWLERLV